jgi:creatinine amidohydrolase
VNERAATPRLGHLTWREAADWFRRDPRLLLPVGSFLPHGPHLPLQTDVLITTALAEGIGARHGVLVAPTLPYGGGSDADRAYAGAGVLAHKTLHRALNDLVAGFEGQGLRELFLVTTNGYGPHYRALVSVSPGTLRVRAIDTNVIDLSPVLRKPSSPERAGEVETSLLLYLAPGLVRKELMEDVVLDPATLLMRMDGTEPVPLPGTDGVVGRPTAATAEKGRRIYEYLVQYIGDRLFRQDVVEDA